MNRTVSLIVLLFALFIVLPYSAFGQSQRLRVTSVEIAFTDDIRNGHCTGKFGFCLIISFERARADRVQGVLGDVSIEQAADGTQKLRVDFKSPLTENDGTRRQRPIHVFKNGLKLDTKAAKELGYHHIKLLEGDYPIVYPDEKSPGYVLVDVDVKPQ